MTEEAPPSNQNPSASGSLSKMRRKAVIWISIALVILFWDEVFEITVHVLHIIIEYLELAIEELIILIFHVEEHESQMFTAWIGLGSFIALGVIGYLRLVRLFIVNLEAGAIFGSGSKSIFRRIGSPFV